MEKKSNKDNNNNNVNTENNASDSSFIIDSTPSSNTKDNQNVTEIPNKSEEMPKIKQELKLKSDSFDNIKSNLNTLKNEELKFDKIYPFLDKKSCKIASDGKCAITCILNAYLNLNPVFEIMQDAKKRYGKRIIFKVSLNDGRKFVLKRIELNTDEKGIMLNAKALKVIDDAMREYYITKTFGLICKSVAKVIDMKEYYSESENKMFIEMLSEYCGTNLLEIPAITDQSEITCMIYQLVCALSLMEDAGIAHFDIKPQNLVYQKPSLKLIDFGSAISFFASPKSVEQAVANNKIQEYSPFYSPPEIFKLISKGDKFINSKQIIPNKVDIFCFGITLASILLRMNAKKIEREEKDDEKLNEWLINQINGKLTEVGLQKYAGLIQKCLSYNSELRPSFNSLKAELEAIIKKENYNEIIAQYGNNDNKINAIEIADMYLKINEFDAAISFLRKSLENTNLSLSPKDIIIAKTKLGHAYAQIGQNDIAIKCLNEAEKMLDSDNVNEQYARICIYSGDAYRGMGIIEKAESYYSKALNVLQNLSDSDKCLLAIVFNNLGAMNHSLGKFYDSIKYHEAALAIRKAISGEEHPSLKEVYNNLGVTYISVGKYENAIKLLTKAMNILIKVNGTEHSDLAVIYINLGTAYQQLSNNNFAIEFYIKGMNIIKKMYGEDHPLLATVFNNLGFVYYKQCKFQDSIQFSTKSLNILKKIYKEDHPDIAISFSNLGLSYQELGNVEEAINNYKKSFDIIAKKYGEDNFELSKLYNNLGVAYESQFKHNEALDAFTKAMEILKKSYKEYHPLIATTFCNMGSAYNGLGKFETSIECHNKAIELMKKESNVESPELAISYYKLAQTYFKQEKYKTCCEFCTKSINIFQKFGDEHKSGLAFANSLMGSVYYKLRNYKSSEEFLKKALADIIEIYGEDNISIAPTYKSLGALYNWLGKDQLAAEFYTKYINLWSKTFGKENINISTVYSYIGDIYMRLKNFNLALESYLNSLKIMKIIKGEENKDIAEIFFLIGIIFNSLEKYAISIYYGLKSEKIYEKILLPREEQLICIYGFLETVYRKSGNTIKSAEYKKKVLQNK